MKRANKAQMKIKKNLVIQEAMIYKKTANTNEKSAKETFVQSDKPIDKSRVVDNENISPNIKEKEDGYGPIF